jgi:hypothetical protein
MTTSHDAEVLWKHPTPETTPMYQFKKALEKEKNIKLEVGRLGL